MWQLPAIYLLGFIITAIVIRKKVVNDEQQVALSLLWPSLVLLLVCTLPHQIVNLMNYLTKNKIKKDETD